MPTINKSFLLKLVLTTALLVGSLFAVHAVQARRIPDALKRMADRSAEQGKSDAAIHFLRQYLEFAPNDVDARERLAKLLRDRLGPNQDPSDLIFVYDKILRADPSRSAVRREVLIRCLDIARYSDAESHAEILLQEFPTDPDLWQKLAAAQAGLQKPDAATASYENAIKHDPTDPVAYERLAQYHWRDLKQPAEARKVLDRMVAAMPLEARPLVTRARFDLYAGESTTPARDVMPDLARALELDPENADALLLMAEQHQKRRELALAHDCLAAGVKLHPQDVRLVRSLAWLELNRGNLGSAVAILEEGMTRSRTGIDLLGPLADLLVQLGETGRTEEIIARLERRPERTAKLQVKYLKARVAMRQLQWGPAIELLTSLRTDAMGIPGLESQANLLLAMCFQKQGETEKEQDTLKLVLNKDPKSLPARVALGQSYLNMGRFDDARKEYRAAVDSPYANGSTHATLVRLWMAQLRAVGAASPRDWQALEDVARKLADPKVTLFGPGSTEGVRLLAEVVEARGDGKRAAAILRAECSRRPADTKLWAALADNVTDLAGVGVGLGIIDEAQAATGDGADLRLARADLYARDPARLRPLDQLTAQIDTWPDGEQLRLLYGLAEIADRLGDESRTLSIFQRIAARRPADLAVWEALAERAIRAGKTTIATDARANLEKLDPTGKSASLCTAWSVIASGKADDAGGAIENLVKNFGSTPDRAEACVALAELRTLAGDRAAASALLDRAVRLEPTRFGPVQAYLAHLARLGGAPLSSTVARFATDHRWAGEPFRRAVQIAALRVEREPAKRLLDAARPYVEHRPSGLGWLGDCYLAVGNPTDAADCFRKATISPVANADDFLRLAVRSAEMGDPAAATAAISTAKKALPAGLYLQTAAAFADSPAAAKDWQPTLANAAERRTFTQARLSLKLSRFQRTEAVDLLEGFLKSPDTTASDAAWARRNLAMLLAIRGGASDRTRAMELLTEAGEKIGETADEKRASAAVLTALARYLDGSERTTVLTKATKILTEIVEMTKSPRDGFLLAQVYRAAGNRAMSTAVMNNLLKADPNNLDFHLFCLEEVVDAGQMAVAEAFAQRILVLAPTDFHAVTAVAKFECKAGRPDRGFALAEGYVRTADATAGDLPTKTARAAELLDQLARLPGVKRTEIARKMVQSAVEKYDGLAPTRPEAVVAAAGLLAAAGRPADGFAFVEKHGKSLTPKLRAAAGIAILRSSEGSEQQFATVRKWLDEALAIQPDSNTLRLNEGEFFALKRDYPAAEKAYRTVLDRDPRNVVALNNLAWILAPRPESAKDALALIDRAVSEMGLTGELLDTRARVRIAAKQFELAERDLREALTQEKTPLRMFHLALAKQGQTPPRETEARDAFRQAKNRGLEPAIVHPADLPMFRVLEATGAN